MQYREREGENEFNGGTGIKKTKSVALCNTCVRFNALPSKPLVLFCSVSLSLVLSPSSALSDTVARAQVGGRGLVPVALCAYKPEDRGGTATSNWE